MDTFLYQAVAAAAAAVIVEVIVALAILPLYIIKSKIKIKILASYSIYMLLQSNSIYRSSFHRSMNIITD